MPYRYRVLALLFLLSVITFLDRVCLSVAGPRIQADLNLSPERWGWVVSVFAISYGAFEIPTGILGDRIGARRVLPRIVVWWSFFTCLTGAATNYIYLLVVRFLFGAGEAGAYPNSSAAVSRWFPRTELARAHGIIWVASRLGGALTPLFLVPIQAWFGWRVGFYAFGAIGMIWAAIWFRWFRDRPAEMPGISQGELQEIGDIHVERAHRALPWNIALRSGNFWRILFMYHTFAYASFFYISWLHTYMVKGRGFDERQMAFISSLPFVFGAIGNLAGGFAGDHLVRSLGPRWGRRAVGLSGMVVSAVCTLSAALSEDKMTALVFLALGAGAADFTIPTCWATCLDIGRKYAGAVTASMNTAGQVGSFVSGLLFGYLVKLSNNYDFPLIPISAISLITALTWLTIDPTQELVPEDSPSGGRVGSPVISGATIK
jgi:MFS family permease